MGTHAVECGGLRVSFHGELYDRAELRRQLTDAGASDLSCDGALMAYGFQRWGFEPLLRRVEGMFAVAIWDPRLRTLYLARDRIGARALYYSLTQNFLVAGSDLKAVVGALPCRPEPEAGILPLYLSHGFIPAPWTPFHNVWKLPPAGAAILRERRGVLEKHELTYWKLDFSRKQRLRYAEAAEGLDQHLKTAVSRRTMSDGSLGLLCRVGGDSYALHAHDKQPVQSVEAIAAACLGEARRTAPWLADLDHGPRHEDPWKEDRLELLLDLMWSQGEPLAGLDALLAHAMSVSAARQANVILVDHGREAWMGASSPITSRMAAIYRHTVNQAWRERLERMSTAVCSGRRVPLLVENVWSMARAGAVPEGHVDFEPDIWRDDLRRHLLQKEVKRQSLISPRGWHARILESISVDGPEDARRALRICGALPSDTLAGMQSVAGVDSARLRFPFLDTDLLSFLATLPGVVVERWATQSRARVPFQRTVAPSRARGPDGLTRLRDYTRGRLREHIESLLLSARTLDRGYFVAETVAATVEQHMSGRFDHTSRIWALVAWEHWCRMYVDEAAISEKMGGQKAA